MSPTSIILHDVDVGDINSTPRTPRFFTLGGLSSTVNGYLSPSTPYAPAHQLADWQGYPISPMPTTPTSICFGPPLPTPTRTSFEPVELPGSILSPNYGFPPSTPSRTRGTSFDESCTSSPPDLTPSSERTSEMSLFRSLTNRFPEPDDPIKNGKHVSHMNEFELWDVMQEMSEAQLKGVWGKTIRKKVQERAKLMDQLRVEYKSQIEALNKMNVTSEHLDSLITLANSAEAITNRCNEVSHAVQTSLTDDRNRLQTELHSIHEVHKLHFQKLKQQYATQIEKFVKYFEFHKADNGDVKDLISQEIKSIIFEYYETKDSSPPFEDALEAQEQDVTMPADEYVGLHHELQRLRKREKELENLLLNQQQVIDENKEEIDLFKLDVKLYKRDQKEKEEEFQALKSAFDHMVTVKDEKIDQLKAAGRQTKIEANVTEEALSSAHNQLATKDHTIERMNRNLKLLQGLTSPKTAGDYLILGYQSSPCGSEPESTTDPRVALDFAGHDGSTNTHPLSAAFEHDKDRNLYSHPNVSQTNLSQVSTDSARWMASSRPRTAGDPAAHRYLTINDEDPSERGYPAPSLSPALTTPTTSTLRPQFNLNKDLPTPPAGSLRAAMAARGSPMPKVKELKAEEKQLTFKHSDGELSTHSDETRARDLRNEFPELIRFRVQGLPDIPDDM